MPDEAPAALPARVPRPFPWTVAILAGTVVVLALLALVAYLWTLGETKTVVEGALHTVQTAVTELPTIAEKFQRGTITTTFLESIPRTASSGGDVLELATAEATEVFKREDSKTTLWGWVDLGTTVSEIRVPVTFRYHLRLSDTWRLTTRGNVCVVMAPPVRPSNPPAIHTDRMEKRTENGWGRSNAAENLTSLEQSMTPTLEGRAGDRAHMRHVREDCRKAVAEYVKHWLLREDHWRKDRFTSIVVVFADEVAVPTEEALERKADHPTIILDPVVPAAP